MLSLTSAATHARLDIEGALLRQDRQAWKLPILEVGGRFVYLTRTRPGDRAPRCLVTQVLYKHALIPDQIALPQLVRVALSRYVRPRDDVEAEMPGRHRSRGLPPIGLLQEA